MRTYQVTWVVEVEAETPKEAVVQAVNAIHPADSETILLQVREEPFDTPSPMWDVLDLYYDGTMELRRLR